MQYGITKLHTGNQHFLEISQDEFNVVKVAKRCLIEVLGIEEKYNFVLENYAEFEKELLELNLEHMIFFNFDWAAFQREIHTINRRLINLLTTCRLYIDQIPHNLKSIFGAEAGCDLHIKQRMSQEYDANLSYRALEALRNYVQHRGLPIYGLNYNMTRQKSPQEMFFKYTITPSLKVSKIKEEQGFKAAVLQELEAVGEDIDIKPYVRQYIDSISKIHSSVRKLYEGELVKWDQLLLNLFKRFTESFGTDIQGLAIVALRDDGTFDESIQIYDELIRYRQWLMKKNQNWAHYSRSNITSEVYVKDS